MSDRMLKIDERLRQLGMRLPTPPAPAGAYRPVVIRNGVGCVSGQFPFLDGELRFPGRVGAEVSERDALQAAEIAATNVIAHLRNALPDFELDGLLRVEGYVASAPGFTAQPRILDAASRLFVAVFGPDVGAHARAAFSVPQLPLNAVIELVVTFGASLPRDGK